jgi:acid phosphatase type 7
MKAFCNFFSVVLFFSLTASAQDPAKTSEPIGTQDQPKAPPRRPGPQANLLRGPYLQVATAHSIVVRWRTDDLTRGLVRYGTAAGQLDKVAVDSLLVTEHKIKLMGLAPGTKYFYSIGSWQDTLQSGPGNYFVTLPVPGAIGSYRIAAIGDCGNNSVNQRNVRDQVVHYLGDRYLDAWILMGDNSYNSGRDAEFQSNFFNIYKDNLLNKYPLFPSPGNHDYNDGDRFNEKTAQDTHDVAYFHNFSMPVDGEAGGVASHNPAFYSFDLGNIHFLSLDSYGREENQRMYDTAGPQVQWIKRDLDAIRSSSPADNTSGTADRTSGADDPAIHKAQWVVAYWHHPPYTMGSHNSDKETELVHIRENFIRILERYGVDLILCGHSHDYERSRLIKGHYGMEASFSNANLINPSSGFYDGSTNSCPYLKDAASGYTGTVYVVSGSAGQLGGKQASFPHEALPFSDADHGGAGMLEVEGNRLDWKWVTADGTIRDHFTMMKDVNRHRVLSIHKGETVTLTASFTGSYRWSTGAATGRSILVKPSSTTVYTVKDPYHCLEDRFEVRVMR